MDIKILSNAKKNIKNLFGIDRPSSSLEKLYKDKEYLEAYSQHTDLRVEADPKSSIGGMWEEIGKLQFEFLIKMNLKPHHKMLDLGCGTLRGGRHFIKYLDPGNYCGIDISPKAISAAKQLIEQEGFANRRPHLLVSENKDLRFREFRGETFDYILAQSVFTHLKPEHIKECFENISSIMHHSSVFYFTYFEREEYRQMNLKTFHYPFSFFESLAKPYGFKLQDYSKDYNHPKGQLMVELRHL